MATRPAEPISPKEVWDLPHEDAEDYLFQYVNELRVKVFDRTDDYNESIEQLEEGDSVTFDDIYTIMQNHPANIRWPIPSKTTLELYEDLDFEYESNLYVAEDSIIVVNERLDEAISLLKSRQIDDFLESLDSFTDDYATIHNNIRNLGEAEKWLSIIDTLPIAKEEDTTKRSELRETVIQIINEMSRKLCELIAKAPHALMQIPWWELERVVGTAFEGLGFNVQVTPPSKDGGKDVIAECSLRGKKVTYFIEIKHWRSGKRPGLQNIFDFLEVNVKERTDGGLFLSSSQASRVRATHLTKVQCVALTLRTLLTSQEGKNGAGGQGDVVDFVDLLHSRGRQGDVVDIVDLLHSSRFQRLRPRISQHRQQRSLASLIAVRPDSNGRNQSIGIRRTTT